MNTLYFENIQKNFGFGFMRQVTVTFRISFAWTASAAASAANTISLRLIYYVFE